MMDLALYILIALLAYTLRKWWACKRKLVAANRFTGIQAKIIAQKNVDLAVKQEFIELLSQRLAIARVEDEEILGASVIE
jgi:hypothetical protein